MSLKKCKECGLMVSSEAKTCPHCGAKKRRSAGKRAWFIFCYSILAFIVLVFLYTLSLPEHIGKVDTYFNFFPDAKKDIAKQVKKWINTETKIPKELLITCKSVLLIKESRRKYTDFAEFSKGGNVGVTVDVDKDGTMIFRLDQTDLIALYANTKLEFADIADYKLTSKYTSLGNGQQSENTSRFTIGDWVNQLKNRKACIIKVKIDRASMLTVNVAIPLISTITIYCSIDHDTKTCITEGCEDGSGQGSTDSEETFQAMNQLYQLIQLKNDEDAKAYFERGAESITEGRFQEAIELLKEAVRIKPDWADAYSAWGGAIMYLAQKKVGQTRQELIAEAKEKCLKAESIKTGKGAYNLACISALIGDKAECQKWLNNQLRSYFSVLVR
jgi:hypothetical protein